MPGFQNTANLYESYDTTIGFQEVPDPGANGTFVLRGRWGMYCIIASGTRKLPDNIPPFIKFYVYATGNVTLTNAAGTNVATLVSGQVAECMPVSATVWVSHVFNVGGNAAAVPIVDAGSLTAATEVETALQNIMRATFAIRIPMTSFTTADGTPLAKWADNASPNPGFNLANSEAFGIRWNDNATQNQPILTSVVMPIRASADIGQPFTLNVLASKTGATLADATTFTIAAFAQLTTIAHDGTTDFGVATSAMVGNAPAKRVQHVTSTMTLPANGTNPVVMTFSITPTSGTLGTDDVIIHGIWLNYAY